MNKPNQKTQNSGTYAFADAEYETMLKDALDLSWAEDEFPPPELVASWLYRIAHGCRTIH